jgi:hypothetical protein
LPETAALVDDAVRLFQSKHQLKSGVEMNAQKVWDVARDELLKAHDVDWVVMR